MDPEWARHLSLGLQASLCIPYNLQRIFNTLYPWLYSVIVLDYNKRHREENRSSRDVVYQTNVKNLMDRKETQCKCIERGMFKDHC